MRFADELQVSPSDRGSLRGESLKAAVDYDERVNAHVFYERIRDSYGSIENAPKAEIKRWEDDRATTKSVVDAINVLASVANGSSQRDLAVDIFAAMLRNHRTLQAQVFSALLGFMRIYADAPYDLRNKAAVVAAKQITEFADAQGIYIPLV